MDPVAKGPYLLWTADRNKKELNPDKSHPPQDPSASAARQIIITANATAAAVPTSEHEEVCRRIDRILGQLEFLYRAGDPVSESKFREQYAEVFALGQQALETGQGNAAKANERLDAIEGDLIAEEWKRVLDERKHKIANGGDVPSDAQQGPFLLFASDEKGKALNRPTDGSHPKQDPQDERARQIIFSRNPGAKIANADEMKVYYHADRILHALGHLYRAGDAANEAKFRKFYVSVFGVSRLAVEVQKLELPAALKELDVIDKDLVEDEGPIVKTKKIKAQLSAAAWFLGPLVILWSVLRLIANDGEVDRFLQRLGASHLIWANLVVLSIGSLVGVCVSYAYRKPDFSSVDDLVAADKDQLLPWLRLLLIGVLSVILVLFARAGLGDLSIGTFKFGNVLTGGQTAVFVVGVLCGIGEQLLPNTVMTTKSFLGASKGADSAASKRADTNKSS